MTHQHNTSHIMTTYTNIQSTYSPDMHSEGVSMHTGRSLNAHRMHTTSISLPPGTSAEQGRSNGRAGVGLLSIPNGSRRYPEGLQRHFHSLASLNCACAEQGRSALLRMVVMVVMMMFGVSAWAQTIVATWDWKTSGTVVDGFSEINGTTGTIPSDVSGISLDINATSGRVYDNGNNIAINPGTVISVPVNSTDDVVLVENYSGYTGYKVGKQTPSGNSVIHYVSEEEATAKKVDITITSTGTVYLHSIKLAKNTVAKTSYTAVWNWNQAASSIASSLKQTYQYGSSTNPQMGFMESSVSGVVLSVDVTGGSDQKVEYANNGTGYINFVTGAKLYIPVKSVGDEIIIDAYPSNAGYKIGESGSTQSADKVTYPVTDADVQKGYVAIIATSNKYLCTITLKHFEFKDFALNMYNGSPFFTNSPSGTYYVVVDENGDATKTQVKPEYYNAEMSFDGYNGDTHGYANISAKIRVVPGKYDITIGGCTSTGEYIIKDKDGNSLLPAGEHFLPNASCFAGTAETKYTQRITVTDAMEVTIGNNGSNATYTPYFAISKIQESGNELNVIVNPADAGTVEGAGKYPAGTSVILKASAKRGYRFVEWRDNSDNQVSTNSMYEYVMPDTEVTLKAVFEALTPYQITFSKGGDSAIEGTLPATVDNYEGETWIVPANHTLYKEGYTCDGWTDGTNLYAIGSTVSETKALTPHFSENTYSITTRPEALTVSFEQTTGRDNYTSSSQGFFVGQTTGSNPIDVKAVLSGTFTGNGNDYIYIGSNTTITVPSCKGSTITFELYSAGTINIDGNDVTTGGSDHTNTISYTVQDVRTSSVISNLPGQYMRRLKVTYPQLPPTITTDLSSTASVTVGQAQDFSIVASDATSYQWYKNSTNSTSGVTAIDGATSATYSYTASAAGTEYIYCAATNAGGTNNSTICAVTATAASTTTTLINYEHSSPVSSGVTLGGTTLLVSVKIHTNTDAVDCIQLKNGYTTDNAYNNNSITLSTDGGFKVGDVLTISGFFNNADDTKLAKAEIFKVNSDNTCTTVWTSEQFVNGRTSADDPVEQAYTLTEDMDVIYIGRNGNTGTNIYTIKVTRAGGSTPSTPTYSDLSDVQTTTSNPFGFAVASSRTETGTSAVTGGGMHDPQTIIDALPSGWAHGTSYTLTSNSKKVIVLASTGSDMKSDVQSAISANDIIIFDGVDDTHKDFIIGSVMKMSSISNKTLLGINGARLCTEWYLKDTDRSALDAQNVKNLSTSTKVTYNGEQVEEAEAKTREVLSGIYGNENYRNAGIFEFTGGTNLIIRNIKFVGPGACDVGGYDLLAFKGVTHAWVDHCEFTDGIDGNFDITEASDFVTVSWNKFHYTECSYMHQNTNLVGSSDSKDSDKTHLNITFAYNNWGLGCNARMPMARYGKIHMLNNYYSCTGNKTSCINPRTQSEFLLDANHWISGITKVFEPGTGDNVPSAYSWSTNNVIKGTTQTGCGAPSANLGATVTVPYIYSTLDPETLPTVIPANAGATLTVTMPTAPISDNFVLDLTKNTYEVVSGALPTDASVGGSWHDATHGYSNAVVSFKVTKPSLITFTGCDYGNTLKIQHGSTEKIYNPKHIGCGGKVTYLHNSSDETTITVRADYLSYLSLEPVTSSMTLESASGTAYDAIVSNADQLRYALASAPGGTTRYRIFLKNGEYDLGTKYGTFVNDYVTLVGESRDGVIIQNSPAKEGIWTSATLVTGDHVVMQNLSLKCTVTASSEGKRGTALYDNGTGNKYKNIRLLGYQDTYYSADATNSLFEDCEIYGSVDFICGSGNVWFEKCSLKIESNETAYITAARRNGISESSYKGYIFNECTVDNVDGANMAGKYYLGRAWDSNAKVEYHKTTYNIAPNSEKWTGMSGATHAIAIDDNEVSSTTAPAAVAILSAPVSVTLSGSALSWSAVTNASGYAIYRGATLITTVGSSVTSYDVSAYSAAPARRRTMKKTAATETTFKVASISGEGVIGEAAEAVTPQAKEWNFSNWDAVTAGNMANPLVVDGLSVYPLYDNTDTQKSAIDSNNKSIDGYSFTKRFKFGGQSTSAKSGTGYLKFDVTGPTDIVVYGMCGSSSATSDIYLSTECCSTSKYLKKWEGVSGSAISKNEYSYTGGAATIYLYCSTSSANIYCIKATPKLLSDLTAVTTSKSMTVGDADWNIVKDTDYTTSSTGVVTLASSNTDVATIVDGKVHAVAAGNATITISQAADATYSAGSCEITVTVTAAGPSYPITAKWDFTKSGYPATGFEGNSGTLVANEGEPLELEVDATSGKLASNGGGWGQFNQGTIIKVPVGTVNDEVKVNVYQAGACAVSGTTTTELTTTINPSETDVQNGFVVVKATGNGYLGYIQVVQHDPTILPERTATWDFQNGSPESIKSTNIQGVTGTVASNIDGVSLNVDATCTNGKLEYNASGYAQYNSGTIISVPIRHDGDVVTVVAYPGQYKYTVAGTAATANETTYTANAADATAGKVDIIATGGAYLYSISVKQVQCKASNLAIITGKETKTIVVDDPDWAPVKDTDYTTSSTGAITLTSSDTDVATIVNGKVHAVAAGTATITIKQAPDATYAAGTCSITVTVEAASNTEKIEKVLYTTKFQDWTAADSNTEESTVSKKTTDNQDLIFSLLETQVAPTGTNTKFSDPSTEGYLMAAKTATPYIKTSTLASITTVKFVHAATGNERGWGLKVKGDGDSDWVTVSDAVANPSSGKEVTVDVNRTNVQLWFYNLNSSQNAYMTSLEIKGNVEVPKRNFKDFKIDFRTDSYTVVKPDSKQLPTGVEVSGSFHDAQHGYSGAVVKVPVDGPVKFTIGGCGYTNNATVKDAEGNVLATLDTRGAGCDNGFGTYNNYVTYTYNVEHPAEGTYLTFNLGNYCPYFFAEKCEYIPQVTVTYYDSNGTTVLGSETVDGNSPLAYKYNASNVTVASGSKFRGWFDKPFSTADDYTGKKVAEGKALTEDISLYAGVSPLEKAEEGVTYNYNFKKENFYQDDHECITVTNGSLHNTSHGWEMKANGTIVIPTTRFTKVTLELCQYGASGKIKATTLNDVGTVSPDLIDSQVEVDKTTAVMEYSGPATTMTLTFDNGGYIHGVKVEYVVLPEISLANQITGEKLAAPFNELDANAGSVSKSKSTHQNLGTSYMTGDVVTINASANYGYKITGIVCSSGTVSDIDYKDANHTSATAKYTVGTANATVTVQYERLTLGGKIRLESTNTLLGSVDFATDDIHENFRVKGDGYVESYFVLGDVVTASSDAADDYTIDKWTKGDGADETTGNTRSITVTSDEQTFKASFKHGISGTVTFDIKNAILQNKAGTVTASSYDLTTFTLSNDAISYSATEPTGGTTSSFSIPKYYALFKTGYTVVKWVEKGNTSSEYELGKNYSFQEGKTDITLVPVLKENPTTQFNRLNEPIMTYEFGAGPGIRAQKVSFGKNTQTFWSAQVWVEAIDKTIRYPHYRDVALYVNTGSKGYIRNGDLPEWASFGPGTELYIASCAGTKVEICCYAPITTTKFGEAEFVLDEEKTDADNHLYVYTAITESPAQRVPIVIGDDYSYYKYIKVYSKMADRNNLFVNVDDNAHGKIAKVEAINSSEDILNPIEYVDGGGYSFNQGNGVKVTFKRRFGFEFDKIVDPDKADADGNPLAVLQMNNDGSVNMVNLNNATTVEEVVQNKDAQGNNNGTWGDENLSESSHVFYFKELAPTVAEDMVDSLRTKYEVSFNITTHRNLEVYFKEKPTYYVTYSAGQYATGIAPVGEWLEQDDAFTIPVNNTLYYEGHTLKYWVDSEYDYSKPKAENKSEDIATNHVYEIGETYHLSKNWGSASDKDYNLRLFPVFERNEFTLLDAVAESDTNGKTATWSLIKKPTKSDTWSAIKGKDVLLSAPTIHVERGTGILVTQLLNAENKWIDLMIDLDAADKTVNGSRVNGKFANDSKGYENRCQITNNSVLTFPTTKDCVVKLVALGEVSKTVIAGSTSYTKGKEPEVTYTGNAATQKVEFKGDYEYYTTFSVTYKHQAVSEPALTKVSVGSTELTFEQLNELINNHSLNYNVTVDLETESIPDVTGEASNDGKVTATKATVTNKTSTITLKSANGTLIDTYTLNFIPELPSGSGTPKFKKFIINGVDYGEGNKEIEITNMPVSGTITIEFDRTMDRTSIISENLGSSHTYTAEAGKELVFKYWSLPTNTNSTLTFPVSYFKDIYGTEGSTDGGYLQLKLHFSSTPVSVEHRKFDYVVGKDGDVNAAIAAANAAEGTDRYYVFIPDGTYELTGNENITSAITSDGKAPADGTGTNRTDLLGTTFNNHKTQITRANVSLIGQSTKGVTLYNTPIIEGISYTATIHTGKDAKDFYAEELSLENRFPYMTSLEKQGSSGAGRGVCFQDQGNRTILKNVSMMSWQDTYYSNNAENDYRAYWEDCTLGGVVDWACGDGNIWWERCNILIRDRSGNNFAAPHTEPGQQWGYVFNKCRIMPEPGVTMEKLKGKDWTIARPWGGINENEPEKSQSPACTFLNTYFSILPKDAGWGSMGASLVLRFHEYNSMDGNGNKISLGARSLASSNPAAGSDECILTEALAGQYTMENVLGGSDAFTPKSFTQQIDAASGAAADKDANNTMTWNDDIEIDDDVLQWSTLDAALCYFVFKKNDEGKWIYKTNVAQTSDTQTKLSISLESLGKGTYCVRAANQRGGLGAATKAVEYIAADRKTITVGNTYTVEVTGESGEKENKNVGWSTICLPFNAKLKYAVDDEGNTVPGKNIKVYAAVSISDNVITLRKVDYLTKNVGYVIYGDPGNYVFAATSHTAMETSEYGYDHDSYLKGNPTETPVTAKASCYTLAYKPAISGIGFYKYIGTTLNPYKAYLVATDYVTYNESNEDEQDVISSAARRGIIFRIIDEEEDAVDIDAVDVIDETNRVDDRIYDLQGRMVKTPIPGNIYIKGGKKILWR